MSLYAPTCFVCGKKIDGDRVGTKIDGSVSYRHPTCKPPKTPKKKTKKKRMGAKALVNVYKAAGALPKIT